MFDLLGLIFEEFADAVSSLFDSGTDAAGVGSGIPAVAPLDMSTIGTPLPVDTSLDTGSWVASTDGGISDNRFDPKPPAGPYTP